MMDLREALLETAFDADEAARPGGADPWIAAASVLTHFEPLTLKSAAGTLPPTAPAMVDLLDASAPSRASRHARCLRYGARRQALTRLATREAMRAQLALNPLPDHPTQAAFQSLLDGPSAVQPLLESGDPVTLAALAEAADWLDGILEGLPAAQDIDARMSRARLLKPLRRLVGDHFAGREDVLAEIATHLDLAPEGSVLMLQGPGGVGKSTVLAKFILDAIETRPDPPTVMVLNLDDPQLVIDDPFTLLQEAGRQLRVQHPNLNASLDRTGDYIASLQRRSRSMSGLESVSGGTVDWTVVSSIAQEIIGLIPGSQPVLLVIDTFEEAQTTGPSAVNRLMQLVDSLRSGNPRLSVIIAGRVDEASARRHTLTLEALDPVAARAVLEKVAGLGRLPDDLADRIFAVAQGNPLATHLAGTIVAAEGPDAFRRDADLTRLIGQIRTEKVQAQLYGRVLGHIRNPEVRRLAYPGLILRRITPDVLRHVLAEPCGVTIADDAEAARLFDLFAAEVALAEPEPGTGALRYREDVRRVILADLRADQPELTALIDRAATDYYRAQSGAVARAEEIYHMLASGADHDFVDARWEPGVEPYLVRSIEELPPRAQVFLVNRLNMDLRPDLQDAADQQQWEQNAERTARALLRDDLPEEALSVLNQRAARLPGSGLHLTEAEALTMLGQTASALTIIAEGLARAEAAGDRLLVVNLRLLEGMVHERAGPSPSSIPTPPDRPVPASPVRPAGAPVQARRLSRKRGAAGLPMLLMVMLLVLMVVMVVVWLFLPQRNATKGPAPAGVPATLPPAAMQPPSDRTGLPGTITRPVILPPDAILPPDTPSDLVAEALPPEAAPLEAVAENRLTPFALLAVSIGVAGIWMWSRMRRRAQDRPSTALDMSAPKDVVTPSPPSALQAIQHAATEAYRVATLTHNDLARLRAIAGLLRLHRTAAPPAGPDPETLVAEAEGIIDRIGMTALYDAPSLMRELAAELGMRNPQLLATALRVTGAYVTLPDDLRRDLGPGSAAAATSDPRARAILGDMEMPGDGTVNALSMIATSRGPDQRYAMMALATDLLAAELDARRGALPPADIRQRPLPWRQSAVQSQDTSWFNLTKAAF